MTEIVHSPPEHHAPTSPPPQGLAPPARTGLSPCRVDDPPLLGLRVRARRLLPLARPLRADRRLDDHHGRRLPDAGASRLPHRNRRVRLLGVLRLRPSHSARGPLEPRRHALAGLLPRQHRPQGDRRPVPRDDVLLLRDRRADGDGVPRRAREARPPVRRHADLQRADLRARGADDLPLHHPRLRRARELRRAADARRPGHGLPPPERALVLAASDRRD